MLFLKNIKLFFVAEVANAREKFGVFVYLIFDFFSFHSSLWFVFVLLEKSEKVPKLNLKEFKQRPNERHT